MKHPSETSEDFLLEKFGNSAEFIVEKFTGKRWGNHTETHTFFTEDGGLVILWPHVLYSVDTITIESTTVDLSKVFFYPQYPPYQEIDLSEYTEREGVKVIVVGDYSWGPLPEHIKSIILRIVDHMYKRKDFYQQAQLFEGQRIVDTRKLPSDIVEELRLEMTVL